MADCPTCYAAQVHQHVDLHGPWLGWRIAGRYLITTDRERVPVHVLAQLIHMWMIRVHFDRQGVHLAPPTELSSRNSATKPASARAGNNPRPPGDPSPPRVTAQR